MPSNTLQQIVRFAENYARTNEFAEIDTRQYLVALVNVESNAKQYLAKFSITKDNMLLETTGSGYGTLTVKKDVADMLNIANVLSTNLKCEQTMPEHLLLAILLMPNCYAFGAIDYRLRSVKLSISNLISYVVSQVTGGQMQKPEQLLSLVSNNTTTNTANTNTKVNSTARVVNQPTTAASSQQIPYGKDMTELARQGKYDNCIGRNNEISRIIQILARRNKNNAVLVGYAGVGKSAVVEGLAQAVAAGNVPVELMNKRIVELDIPSMVAGTRYRGDFEERLKNTIDTVIASQDVILFIDEIHNLVGAGGNADGSMDASQILKPLLARGELQTIGATTFDEYAKYIEKDPALERRFQPITVNEPSEQQAIEILTGVANKYEQHHKLKISAKAIESAVKLSMRYITDRYLPDKAFDLLDEACSKVRLDNSNVPEQLQRTARQLSALKVAREKAISAGDLDGIANANSNYQQLLTVYNQQLDKYNNSPSTLVVTDEDVASVVSSWTGILVTQLNSDERQQLANLEKLLGEMVIGQDQAIKVIAKAIKRARAGIKSANRPIGSFIFVGPTGVGKTELAKALSAVMFGSTNELIRLDMSEYMERQSVSRLIGASAGYVGYEDGGQLTERVRRKPYSVVLFDEIEKAHPDVFNILLQILDEGKLTDNHGKVIDFCNTVIILTSNIGVADKSNAIGFGAQDSYSQLSNDTNNALKQHFRPELLNRIDEIVTFDYLDKKAIKQICTLLCYELVKRLKGVITLKFTEKAIDYIAEVGFDSQYGARPIRRTIVRLVEDTIAEKMIAKDIVYGQRVTVELYVDKATGDKKIILDMF